MESNFSSFSQVVDDRVYTEHQQAEPPDTLHYLWKFEKVKDWEDRIRAYPDELKQTYRKLLPELDKILDLI